MPRKKLKRDQDGLHRRPDSQYWWCTIPNESGGSTRRSTGVPVAEDPQGLRAAGVRAAWMRTETPRPADPGKTFDELLLAYLEEVTTTKRAPDRDKWSAKALQPHFTGRALSDIGAAEVRRYIATRKAAGAAPGTVNKEIGLMSAALNWARRELEWDVANPWESRRLREPAGRNRWLTQEEAEGLIAAAETKNARSPWLADFIRLCLYSGLRPGEALALEWSRVDLWRRRITFKEGLDQKNGKAGVIPLNRQATRALVSRARFRARYCPASPWVFCRRNGTRIVSIKTGFAACAAGAGVSNCHPHDLRRTFGSWLVQRGVGIERVSELLRHGDVAITAKVYAHLRPTDLAAAAAVLDVPKKGAVSRSGFTFDQTDTKRKRKLTVTT